MAAANNTNEAELWQKLGKMDADIQNIRNQIESLSAKIDRLDLTVVVERLVKLEKDVGNHEDRLDKLEDNQARIVWFIIAAVAGAILKMVIIDRIAKWVCWSSYFLWRYLQARLVVQWLVCFSRQLSSLFIGSLRKC